METNEPLDWGDIFFTLHKHCHLNKWDIWDYTLPQVTELMKRSNKYIEFEISTRVNPLAMFGGGSSSTPENGISTTDDGYEIADEESINDLARILGGA